MRPVRTCLTPDSVVCLFALLLASGCTAADHAPDDAHQALAEGDRCLEQGLFREAEDHFLRVLSQTPGNAAITYRLSQVYLQTDRIQDAERWLKRTLELSPESRTAAEAHYHLRELAAAHGKPTDQDLLLKQLTSSGRLDAQRAAVWAASLANDRCQEQWRRRPFLPDSYVCNRDGGRWHWGQMDPAGIKGFSTIVSFETDGSKPSVEVFFSSDHVTPRSMDVPRY